MKLIEALEINRVASAEAPRTVSFALVCGFEPLHLRTFLTAHLHRMHPGAKVQLDVGLFGDVTGNLERLRPENSSGAAVVVEWSDLDPRLGFRQLAAWTPEIQPDILTTVQMNLSRIRAAIGRLPEGCIVALCLPTLPLPPLGLTDSFQSAGFEAELYARSAEFAKWAASMSRIRLASPEKMEAVSSLPSRRDVAAELSHGFPYSLAHADAMAGILAWLLRTPAPKKGLITDLDDTFWRGILGEVGVSGVAWDLGDRAQVHGIYQQVLKSLAARGVLLGVASKNDAALVQEAFRRPDLLCSGDGIFPFCVHWKPKSESVSEILRTWNIAADSVVFVDDSPMELAEVRSAHPEIECLLFPKDASQLLPALEAIRNWFGKITIEREDLIRSESIRSASAWRQAETTPTETFEEFLSQAAACLTLHISRKAGESRRPFELVNKTNQFNLNGRRYSEAEWSAYLDQPGSFIATVSYADKFGPLGIIAAALGQVQPDGICLDSWVMSCRAFARRIEHQFITQLFAQFGVGEIRFDYVETPRNGPLRDFLTAFDLLDGGLCLRRERFTASCPALFHAVEVTRE